MLLLSIYLSEEGKRYWSLPGFQCFVFTEHPIMIFSPHHNPGNLGCFIHIMKSSMWSGNSCSS